MGKHTVRRSGEGPPWRVGALIVVAGLVVVSGVAGARRGSDTTTAEQTAPAACDRTVRVLTATSFAPALADLAPTLASAKDCLRLEVERADGRDAATRVASSGADVWIPDDAAWAGMAPEEALLPEGIQGSGTVVATSPIFMVTDDATATRVRRAGGSWLALAGLLRTPSGTRLVVSDPATSGDGMVAAGSVGEAVWMAEGMDASALALGKALGVTRTVTAGTPALPGRRGEVGLVPEYALLPHLDRQTPLQTQLLSGNDHTALLRYTWLPTAASAADPARAVAVESLRQALLGPGSVGALSAAGLRGPAGKTPPAVAAGRVPGLAPKPFPVLGGHHVDHVLATWYQGSRRMSLTMVVDVSGSMAARAPGSDSPLIALVRAGGLSVTRMLPNESRLGLWEFGSRLDGGRDYRRLVPLAQLDAAQRRDMTAALGRLEARRTGTGLHDTILSAYIAARDAYQPGSNQVLVFTDGRNEQDPGGMSMQELGRRIRAAEDPQRPVQLSVVAFGQRPEAEALAKALKPVKAYVQSLDTAQDVEAVFVHIAAGGLHHG